MFCHHEVFSGCTFLQAFELAEDGTTAIIEYDDAETAVEVLVPEGILVVEETQIAQDTEYLLLFLASG